MEEFIVFVLEVILLIIKMRHKPEEAVRMIAEKYNVSYSKLWQAVPRRWK